MHIKFLSLSRCSWIATIIFMAKEQTKIPWWGILYRMMAQEEENTLTNENSKNTIANDSLWWEGAGVVSQRNSCGCIGIFSMNSDIFFFSMYIEREEKTFTIKSKYQREVPSAILNEQDQEGWSNETIPT